MADLSNNKDIEKLTEKLKYLDYVSYLVNNAGYTNLYEFHQIEIHRHRELMRVHMDAPTELVHAVLPKMIDLNRGSIINVASIARLISQS